jgi:hypothetical protein
VTAVGARSVQAPAMERLAVRPSDDGGFGPAQRSGERVDDVMADDARVSIAAKPLRDEDR